VNNRIISVFEHDRLILGTGKRDLTETELAVLQLFHSTKGSLYYSLIFEGIKFSSFVGVLQVGALTIEILPKADRYPGTDDELSVWQKRLVAMLRAVGVLPLQSPSSSSLQLKANSLLDMYFSVFVEETERLLRQGLIKQYRTIESNSLALKGKLLVGKQIQKNFAHQERNYIAHTIYDTANLLNGIIYEALKVLRRINTSMTLQNRINTLLLNFPEQEPVHASDSLFDKISFNRKTEKYRSALTIARLILLNYHPDVRQGSNHLLAILFDMNALWERFIYHSLLRYQKDDEEIRAQNIKPFWQPSGGDETTIRPDIVISRKHSCVVLDTKWKNLKDANPSANDLRQLYVYHHYYQADRVALIYPGYFSSQNGYYFDHAGTPSAKECAVLFLAPSEDIDQWQKQISDAINRWLEASNIPVK